MKIRHIFYCTALTALAMSQASCSNEEEFQGNATTPLQVKVGITQVDTRAGITAAAFTSGESIGLYLYKGTGIADVTGNVYAQVAPHRSKNAHYMEAAGLWKSGTPGEGIILSDVVGKLYAYYPYAATNNNVEATVIPVKVNATQGTGLSTGIKDVTEQSDYMWADPVNNVSNVTSSAVLNMNHALSMVSFKFVKGDYPGEGMISSIKLLNNASRTNIKTGPATLNIGTGELKISGTSGTVTVSPKTILAKQKGASYANHEIARMLVYPTGDTAFSKGDIQAEIVLDGKTYTIGLPAPVEANKYVAGKNYEYTFNLAGKTFGAETPGDSSWKDDVIVTVKKWIDVTAGSEDLVTPDANPTKP